MAWMKNQGCELNCCNEEGIALRTRCKSIVLNFPNKEIRVARPEVSPKTARFGVFEIDFTNTELRKHGVRLRIQRQPFQILAALLDHPGEVVAREELIARLWPDGTVVDFDRGLNAAVTRLRQVLSDSAESPKYVETVAGRGPVFNSRNGSNDLVPAEAQRRDAGEGDQLHTGDVGHGTHDDSGSLG